MKGPVQFEVHWKRKYRPYLSSICSAYGPTANEALEAMINAEEDFRLLKEHGHGCPCEDCCVARVDRSRR